MAVQKDTTTDPSFTRGFHVVLAYLRVRGGTNPGAEKMWELCASVFPGGSKPTVKEHRDAGISCRAWLLSALEMLSSEGFITREKGIEGIEQTVVN